MDMMTPVLARDLAALGRVSEETSSESVLCGLTATLAGGVPGCAGGSAELWREERLVVSASHSELVVLVDSESGLGRGPCAEARSTGRHVIVQDVLRETRWPDYTAMAVRCGVRSVLAMPITVERAVLVLGLYGVRPGVFATRNVTPLAEMLAEQVTVALANMWDYDEVRTDAAQMQEALAGRAVIDQAKGIIMKSSGCSAEEAFDELRRVSQHHQVKVADLARLLVDEHQRSRGGRSVRPDQVL
ncbi:GAF and ANTAR domain-containing protein [Planomonospora sp. ID91781]|uniref:Transcription antitermination regulator n=1 Tax=Planomonospora sphaerica TaxID=161355 RepID=A0A161LA92_9ACTN|nr:MULTISPECIES: GAF and ANTAR domain-containing protein [Planomonospora]MBG0822220.1 GAF and ANTAR domain-containing protein [Planomonospora sp. ID91781]GAT64654.1 transcription antitermination regulator [Planomonospora sphaerica]